MDIKLEKYLKRRGGTPPLERAEGGRELRGESVFAVVIPAFAESESLPATLETLFASFAAAPPGLARKSRVVVVVNNPPADARADSSLSAKIADNMRLLESLRSSRILRGLTGREEMERRPVFEWIDLASPGLEIDPARGVGLARRLGIDAVLPLLDWSRDPVICSLDADTLVDENYVAEVAAFFRGSRGFPGASVRVAHQPGETPEMERAIRRYEEYLDSYVAGLKSAGSPYAYHFIGSAMVFRASAYVKAGGMPAKSAGEDFYFMQALRKTVPKPGEWIGRVDATSVHPSPRISDRVPFGTGRRVEALMKSDNEELDESLPGRRPYAAKDFEALKSLLENARSVLVDYGADAFLASLSGDSADFLRSRGFRAVWPGIVDNTPKSPGRLEWAFHTWFDALRTLQFIHENLNP
jgi:hypothetical protein